MNGHIPEDCGRYFKVLALLSDLKANAQNDHSVIIYLPSCHFKSKPKPKKTTN